MAEETNLYTPRVADIRISKTALEAWMYRANGTWQPDRKPTPKGQRSGPRGHVLVHSDAEFEYWRRRGW